MYTYIIFGVILVLTELVYFKIADKFNIIDKPNHRSSHTEVTLRGGGVIFYFSVLLYFLISGFSYLFFFIGLSLISLVSFIDDIKGLPNKLRILAHLCAVALMFYEVKVFDLPYLVILAVLIVVIGTINAVNFMDGINGITGGYSAICLLTLWYIDRNYIDFCDDSLFGATIIGIMVFIFFNFRNKAKCFAGDVGSVSIAFIMIFMLLKLILVSQTLVFILLLGVYGVDTVLTIIHRLINKENIFQAHRSHLYQVLVNQKGWKHVHTSLVYMSVQLVINLILVFLILDYEWTFQLLASTMIFVGLAFTYVIVKIQILRSKEMQNITA